MKKILSGLFVIMLLVSCENMNNKKTKDEFVPQWAKQVVWYQVFPERFRNGDATNDPKLKDIKNSYPNDNKSPWQIHPWNSDWYQLQQYEKKNGKDIWFNLQRRRYGGDLQGIIDKLDYIKDLGISALYLNPVFESPSLHKYDGATYHHIDPNFGPDPKGDRELMKTEVPHDPKTWVWTKADKLFLKLVEEVHKRNMYIIIDGVFNHMGLNSWAFQDVKKNQEKSPYKDWFKISSWENKEEGTKFEYSGWFGVKELPELNQDSTGIVTGPKKYIFDITKRWMDPANNGDLSKGIDGWRLDVAYMVHHNFWKDWRKKVKSVNPNAYITAEIIDSVEANKAYLEGDEFDAVMNYNFAFASDEYFIKTNEQKISTSEFANKLDTLRKAYPPEVKYVMQNLFDSHDTNRLLSHIVNKNIWQFRNWGTYFQRSAGANKEYLTIKPGKEEYDIMKLMVIFQMTYIGAPMVYYGDEVGMWGANDPCCRKPMIWNDINYENEKCKPDQKKYQQEYIVEQNSGLLNFYKKIIAVRNNNIELQLGNFETIITEDEKDMFVFARTYKNNSIFVLLNNSDIDQEYLIKGYYRDLLNNETIEHKEESPLKIGKKWARILKSIQENE